MTDKYNYQQMETLLLQLFTFTFTQVENNETIDFELVREFINVGEYGLALETLICVITIRNKKIPKTIFNIIYELANLMEFDFFDEKLLAHLVE